MNDDQLAAILKACQKDYRKYAKAVREFTAALAALMEKLEKRDQR